MGAGAQKEARIPNPFRIQLTLPSPCNFFVRMDLFRSTLVDDIKMAASSQCKAISPDCFVLTADRAVVSDKETVESIMLFYKTISLQLKPGPECAAAVVAESS